MTNADHGPDVDPEDIDPDALALVDRIAKVLTDAAHAFAVATDGDPARHPLWDDLGELERNLTRAGIVGLIRRHRTLLEELAAIAQSRP